MAGELVSNLFRNGYTGGMPSGYVTQDSTGKFTGTKDLTDKQKSFARFLINNGGNVESASRAAGITKEYGYRLVRLPKMQEYLHNERELELSDLATLALSTVRTILTDSKAPYGVRASLAMKVINNKHSPAAQEMQKLKDKRIDEMSADELAQHARLLDKALADCGALIDVTPQEEQQPVEEEQFSLSRQDSAEEIAPPPPPPPAADEIDVGPPLKFFIPETSPEK